MLGSWLEALQIANVTASQRNPDGIAVYVSARTIMT